MPIASVAQEGFNSAVAYNAHRPTYVAEAVQKLFKYMEIESASNASITDLAAGTGKFTEILAARKENYNITAVEPHEKMREELEQKHLKRVTVVDGAGEHMPEIKSASQDGVIVAQAFHWMANMNALQEIHRVLKDRCVLGMIWNIEDYNSPKSWETRSEWETRMRDVMWSLEDGTPRFRHMQWKQIFDDQGRSNPFSLHSSDPLFGLPVGEEQIDTTEWLSEEQIWRRFQTYSPVTNLDSEKLETVKKTFWEAVDAPETEKDEQGRVAVHGRVLLAWTSKIPGEPLNRGQN